MAFRERAFSVFSGVQFERSRSFYAARLAFAYAVSVFVFVTLAVASLHQLTSWFAVEFARAAASDPAYPPREKTPIPAAPVTIAATEVSPALIAYSPEPAPPVIGSSTDESAARWSSAAGQTYRTVCVRLCDGYFFPISFSTSSEFFANDEAACRANCASPARLYVFKNPGETPSVMKNLDGKTYKTLDTAFLFRTRHDSACSCKGQPWEEASRDRHRVYALRAAKVRKKASQIEKTELAALESHIDARARQSEAAYRLAGLGGQKRVRNRKIVAGRYKKAPAVTAAKLQPPRGKSQPPGIMGLGVLAGDYEAPQKAARNRSASIGDMIHQSLGGF